jgi:simple sugar transport system permease protein
MTMPVSARHEALEQDSVWKDVLPLVGRVAALVVTTIVLLGILLLLSGQEVGPAFAALWRGAFGSSYAITSATLVRTIPLALAGLAVALAFRAGLLNIGAEGQLLVGATVSTAVLATVTNAIGVGAWGAVLVALVAGAGGGGLWAGIAAWLRMRFAVLEVISTIMLNFVAVAIVGWLVRGPLQEPTRVYPQSASLPTALQLPVLLPGTRLHLGVVIAIAAAVALWWWLRATASGFRVRAVGANPSAAAVAGRIDVPRVTLRAFLMSGALAGLAGSVELTGVTFALYENFSPGYGYTAIAVALLARLHPLGVLLAALLFGALDAGANAMQRDAGVPSVVVQVVNATLILLVLAAERWRGTGRAEAGT